MTHITTITHNIPFQRWPAGHSPDNLGTPAFWNPPIDQQYAQLPFPGFWSEYRVTLFNMDEAELRRRRSQGEVTLLDIDLQTPGNQYGAGLYWPRPRCEIELGLYPSGTLPADHTGPPRPITESERHKARRVLAHETGHFFEDTVRMNRQADDIQRLTYAAFTTILPQLQGSNRAEKIAEGWRAACGCDETRGTFSDGKAANLSPEALALYKCAYWLTAALAGRWVISLVPAVGGCKYLTWVGLAWRWRWISAVDWSQQEHTATGWKPIF